VGDIRGDDPACRLAHQSCLFSVMRDAASKYKVNTDAIALQVKQEFAAKEKSQTTKNPVGKTPSTPIKKVKAT
jgi:ParB family chromosome partitioning protein